MSDLLSPEKPKAATSADVRSCIQSQFGLGGEQYAVLFEVRNGTAWNANRSVDAVVMSLWPSLGMELWGMEIKVSRGDWLREVRDPGKASAVFDHFDRWFLVAPDGVAKPEEVPEPWGWFIPENGRLCKVRDAAKNPNVKPVDRNFLAALMRRTAKTDDAFVTTKLDIALREQRRQFDAEIEERVLGKIEDVRGAAEEWKKLRDLLKEKPTDYIYQPDVIDAIRVVLKAGVAGSFGGLRSLMSAARNTQENLAKIATELGIEEEIKPRRKRV